MALKGLFSEALGKARLCCPALIPPHIVSLTLCCAEPQPCPTEKPVPILWESQDSQGGVTGAGEAEPGRQKLIRVEGQGWTNDRGLQGVRKLCKRHWEGDAGHAGQLDPVVNQIKYNIAIKWI